MARPMVMIGQCLWLLIIMHTLLSIPTFERNKRFLKQQRRLQSKMELARGPIRQHHPSKPSVDFTGQWKSGGRFAITNAEDYWELSIELLTTCTS
uniref:Uncharacterized protein n=1 Tax=Romanomermis culicivorax TaxID=13658 RepID=A0A915IRH4_ROMCU